MPMLHTALILVLPGQFYNTYSGAGMNRSDRALSRPCLRLTLLACNGAFLP
jgi:hypothetical protein